MKTAIEKDTGIFVNGISKSFGKKQVLHKLSLSLQPGSVFGLVGLNGVGKTTLIRVLLGLLKPDEGSCLVLGENPSLQSKSYYRRTGVVLENNGFFGNLSVRENLVFFAKARGMSIEAMDGYFREYWSGTAIGKDTRGVKFFSRGQKMQCALCRAFLGWPEVYFFDEPGVALDIEAYEQFCTMIKIAQLKGATIIISSHQLEAIETLCTGVGILQDGYIMLLEDFQKVQKSEQWIIRTGESGEYKTIIENCGGGTAVYKNGAWLFTVSGDSAITIARIVAELVSAGASIHEVRTQSENFRQSILNHYGKRQ